MRALKTEFLASFKAQLEQPTLPIGTTPEGTRMIAHIVGGTVEGPRFKGTVAKSGGDWFMIRGDGSIRLDVRAAVIAEDGTPIYVSYGGRLVMPPEAMGALADPEALAALDPDSYYFRSAPTFEAPSDSPHAWLNHILAIGVGKLIPGGVEYDLHQVL